MPHMLIDCDIVPERCWGDRLGHMVGIGVGLGANGIERQEGTYDEAMGVLSGHVMTELIINRCA